MSFQRCPVCDGTGYRMSAYTSSCTETCSVCQGTKIISTLTGLPPLHAPVYYTNTTQQLNPQEDVYNIQIGEPQVREPGSE